MIKTVSIALAVTMAAMSFGVEPQEKKQDKSIHHAAMHAEHWTDRHASAPHTKAAKRRRAKRVKSVHHAVMHAEHWVDHHVSAPHKKPGN